MHAGVRKNQTSSGYVHITAVYWVYLFIESSLNHPICYITCTFKTLPDPCLKAQVFWFRLVTPLPLPPAHLCGTFVEVVCLYWKYCGVHGSLPRVMPENQDVSAPSCVVEHRYLQVDNQAVGPTVNTPTTTVGYLSLDCHSPQHSTIVDTIWRITECTCVRAYGKNGMEPAVREEMGKWCLPDKWRSTAQSSFHRSWSKIRGFTWVSCKSSVFSLSTIFEGTTIWSRGTTAYERRSEIRDLEPELGNLITWYHGAFI